tara:strand:- start:177 stop:368 length:192 start_codon:yes stop_codon:yes gene_type:complete
MAESCKIKILGKGGKRKDATDTQKVAIAACNKQKRLDLAKKGKKFVLKTKERFKEKIKGAVNE